MKKLLRSLVVLGAMLTAGSATADLFPEMCPYFGVDYVQTWMKGKHGWKHVFPKTFPGAALYVGTRFCENLGLELGYMGTKHKNRTHSLGTFFGIATGDAVTRSRVRLNQVYLDLNGYLCMCPCWELIGSIGIGSVKPKTRIQIVNQGLLTDAQADGLSSIHGKSRTIWRVGVGTQYMFTECVGGRFMVRILGTSQIRLSGNANFEALRDAGITRKSYKNATSLTAGLFMNF